MPPFVLTRLVAAGAVAVTLAAVVIVPLLGTAEPEPTPADELIAWFEQQLQVVDDPEGREVLEGKLEAARRQREWHIQAREAANSPDIEARRAEEQRKLQQSIDREPEEGETLAPTTPAGDGEISEAARPVWQDKSLVTLNAWIKHIGERRILAVYAGLHADDRAQGMVWVFRQGYYGSNVEFVGEFRTGGRHGGLRVTGAQGSVVELTAEDGTMFFFDADALSFVAPPPRK
jgi:hypothetical protein